MENEYLLYEFVDGSLDPGKENEFFEKLSTSSEMRTELKHLIAMKNAISSDYKAFTPKAATTMGIFSSLGFDAPVPTPSPTPVSKPFFSKPFFPILFSSLGSAVATALIMFSLFKFGLFESKEQALSENDIPGMKSKNQSFAVAGKSDNSNNNNSANTNNLNQVPATKVVYKYIYLKQKLNDKVSKSDNSEINNSEILPIDNNSDLSDLSKVEPINEVISRTDIDTKTTSDRNIDFIKDRNNLLRNNTFTLDPNQYKNIFGGNKIGLSVEIKGNQSFFTNTENVLPPSSQFLGNTNATILYALGSDLQAGAEYRRETFYQTFHGIEKNILYHYEQQPNFETWSLALRYKPTMLSNEYFAPFAQTSLGANNSGTVGRLLLGTEIMPFNNYAFVLGADYSLFRFNYQQQWFYSPKFGFHVGFVLKF